MKGLLLFLLGGLLGGVAGVLGGGLIGTGVGAGAGIATGMQTGACLTIEAAREKGLITAGQVDEIFAAAAQSLAAAAGDLTGESEQSAGSDLADTDAECRAFVAQLKQRVADGRDG